MKSISFGIPSANVSIHPVLCIGMGFHWAWVFSAMVATGKIFSASVVIGAESPVACFASTVFVGICATLLVAGLLGARITPPLRAKGIIGATVLGVAGTALLLLAMTYVPAIAANEVSAAAGLCAGIATGYLLMCWGFAYRSCEGASIAVNVAGGLVLAFVVYGFLLWFNSPLLFAAVSLLTALGEGILCWIAQRPAQEEAAAQRTQETSSLRACLKPAYAKLALILIIFGFLDRILRELALSTFSAGTGFSVSPAEVLLIALCFVALFFVIHIVLGTNSGGRRYSFAPLLTVSIAVAFLFFMDHSDGPTYRIVCVVAYLLFEVHVWDVLARLVRTWRIPAFIVYGLGLFLLFAGQFFSALTDGFASSLAKPLHLETVTEPIVLMLSLLVAVVLLATNEGGGLLSAGAELPRPVEADSGGEDRGRKVKALAHCYLLTEREEEILTMLIQGRSFASISTKLFVSENTTKTHVKNIYRKTGVHSKQELLDMIDEQHCA